MSILIFGLVSGYQDRFGWEHFKAKCDGPKEVTLAMKSLLADSKDGPERLQLVDTDTLQIELEFARAYPDCESCKGKGYHVRWVNSVAKGYMKPEALKIDCGTCGSAGVDESKPMIWKEVT